MSLVCSLSPVIWFEWNVFNSKQTQSKKNFTQLIFGLFNICLEWFTCVTMWTSHNVGAALSMHHFIFNSSHHVNVLDFKSSHSNGSFHRSWANQETWNLFSLLSDSTHDISAVFSRCFFHFCLFFFSKLIYFPGMNSDCICLYFCIIKSFCNNDQKLIPWTYSLQ